MIKHIIILIDSSYSMWNRMENLITELNNFIKSLEEKNLYITIAHFNHSLHYVTKFQNISYIPTFQLKEFVPYGSTALYDVIFEVITEFGYSKEKENNLFIISDGEDTFSKKTENDINLLCEEALRHNWNIIHCNTDASKLHVPTVIFNIDNIDDISNMFGMLNV